VTNRGGLKREIELDDGGKTTDQCTGEKNANGGKERERVKGFENGGSAAKETERLRATNFGRAGKKQCK